MDTALIQRENDLIETLAAEYEALFFIDLVNGKMSIYRMDNRAYEKSRPAATNVLFSDYVALMILTDVADEYKEEVRAFTDLANLRTVLSNGKSASMRYRTCGTPAKYMELRIIKTGYSNTPETAVVSLLDQSELALKESEAARLQLEITRQRSEEIQSENEFVSDIFNLSPSPCFVKDADDAFRYIRCNEAFAIHLGLKKEDIVGHTDEEIFGEKQAKRIREHDFHALRSKSQIYYEDKGSLVIESDHVVVRLKRRITGKNGHALILGVATDVTQERHRAEAETFKADVLGRVVQNNSSEKTIDYIARRLITFFDCQHIMLQRTSGTRSDWFAEGYEKHCQICDDCAMRIACINLFDQNQQIKMDDRDKCTLLSLPALCPTLSLLGRQIYVDGKPWGRLSVHFTTHKHTFVKVGEQVLEMAATAISLAIQKDNARAELSRKNQELLLALDDAKRAERAKSTFLATMSHEIRTPLNAVIGFSEFLRSDNISENERETYLDGITKASHALLALINDILDISKLENSAVDVKGGRCDMHLLFSEMSTIFKFKVNEKEIGLAYMIADDFPVLALREERIRQILLNLIGNAVKFTGKGLVSFSADWNAAEKTLMVKVSDTGIGISPDQLKNIFDPFKQDGSTRGQKVYEGTGLGLPIAKRLAEAAGGSLEVRSNPGQGSVFTLTIPDVEVYESSPTAGNATELTAAENKHSVQIPDDIRFVLVDDVPINLKVLQQYLKRFGIAENRIDLYADAASALDSLDTNEKVAILTDLWMPELNGEAIARAIRSDNAYRNVKVIAVTADADAKSSFDISLFDAVLAKPVTAESLGKVLATLR